MVSPVPPNFRLLLSEGGGVTGVWHGYIIEADGRLLEWKGRVPGRNARVVDTLSTEEIARIWQSVRRHNLLQMESGQAHNYSRQIVIRADTTSRRILWSGATAGKARAKAARGPDRFYQQCLEWLAPHLNKRSP